MTDKEYEQKKRECWKDFCKDNGIDQEVNISIFEAFNQIFDRAYALGKVKETITRENIDRAAEGYADKNFIESIVVEEPWPSAKFAFAQAFKDGANFALGKQEMDDIIKDGFRDHNRMHIAAMMAQGLLSNPKISTFDYMQDRDHLEYVIETALEYADALIQEAEKGEKEKQYPGYATGNGLGNFSGE